MRSANLALKFLLELAAFAAFAYWGASVGVGRGGSWVKAAAHALRPVGSLSGARP